MFQIKIFTFQVKDIYIYFRCAKAAYQDQLWDPMLTFVNSRVCNQMQLSMNFDPAWRQRIRTKFKAKRGKIMNARKIVNYVR